MDNSAAAAATAAAVDGGSSQPKINNYFYSNNDKANFVYVLQHAAKYTPQGIKRAELVAMQLTEKMDDAVVKKDWVLAEEIKVNRDNWQKSADNERTLLQKCQFVLPRAKEKLTYHIKREEFKECAYYEGIVQVVDTYIKPPNHASYTNFINKERLMLPYKVCIDVRDELWTLT